MTLRVIFAGTPMFAIPSLRALVDAGQDVVAVLTQPDRKKGRGRKLSPPPVKSFALERGLPVVQAGRLTDDVVNELLRFQPDIMIVVAFGLIISKQLLSAPRWGCVNVHASLLPRWRGAAPVARAIEAGDTQTGVTIMQMDAGLDTGDILSQVVVPIGEEDTTASLEQRLADAGATELLRVLPALVSDDLQPVVQDERFATYATKMSADDAIINWADAATEIVCQVRACNPWPVARTWLQGQRLRIWEARVSDRSPADGMPGTVVSDDKHALTVMSGEGAVSLQTVQLDGRNRMPVRNFLAGHRISAGARFGHPDHASQQNTVAR